MEEDIVAPMKPHFYKRYLDETHIWRALGQLPQGELSPNPKTNPNPNSKPNQGVMFIRADSLAAPQL